MLPPDTVFIDTSVFIAENYFAPDNRIHTLMRLAAFTKECLGRRIGDMDALKAEASAWYRDRNHRQKGIDRQFTVGDARIKLKHLYPVINIKN